MSRLRRLRGTGVSGDEQKVFAEGGWIDPGNGHKSHSEKMNYAVINYYGNLKTRAFIFLQCSSWGAL